MDLLYYPTFGKHLMDYILTLVQMVGIIINTMKYNGKKWKRQERYSYRLVVPDGGKIYILREKKDVIILHHIQLGLMKHKPPYGIYMKMMVSI